MPWHWLSFAGDDGNLGCSIVEGVDEIDAVRNAHILGCNPGGDVMIAAIPDEAMTRYPEEMRNVLRSKEQWEEFEGEALAKVDF